MKKILFTLMCLVTIMLAGTSLKAQEITITLNPGWNWISYPNAVSMDIEDALGDFTPIQGDVIKSKDNGSATYNGTLWRGIMQQLTPGQGYHYYSMRGEPVSFTFAEPAPQFVVTTAEPTEITATSAISGGSVTSNDSSYVFVFEKGLCWATHPNPIVMNDSYVESGGGVDSFREVMTDLNPGTEYYVRAFVMTPDGITYGNEVTFTTLEGGSGSNAPMGAIDGKFTINASGDQVYFSQGNLQYNAAQGTHQCADGTTKQGTWRFAENQWDFVGSQNPYGGEPGGTVPGSDNNGISETYDGWIDLFGWGTSGWHNDKDPYNVNYQPWSTSGSIVNQDYNFFGYGPSSNMPSPDLTGTSANYDWGVYNSISNGGNQPNQWRTLTQEEWTYVLNSRTTSSGIRYAKANVNNVNGVIVLPDDWVTSYYTLSNTDSTSASFSSNIITVTQWSILEQHGATFLPAAGIRGLPVLQVGIAGYYWSASSTFPYGSGGGARYMFFSDLGLSIYGDNRPRGQSVRLVAPAEN